MTAQTILHVGPHKTGSTALQIAFHEGQGVLDAAGIHYARTGRRGYAHFDLVDWARGRLELDPAVLRAEGDAAPVTLVSCENIVHLDERGQARIRDALPTDRPVRVVYYLRRLVDLWASHWEELLKHGVTLSFDDYLARQTVLRPPHNQRIDQVAQVEALERVFGEGTVEIVAYDAARSAPGGIVDDFVRRVLRRDPLSLRLSKRVVNAAEPRARMELVRLINRIHAALERRAATQELRLAVFRALDEGDVPFRDEFDALVAGRSRPVVIEVGDVVRARQRRFVDLFGARVHGGPVALDAYRNPAPRETDTFEFPVAGEEDLLARVVEFYRSLPEGARRSIGPPL